MIYSILHNVTQSVTIVNMSSAPAERVVRAPDLADWALAHGHGALTTADVAALLAVDPDQVRRRLNVPAHRGEWVQPTRGLWVPVPPEYRTWGAPPGIELVDLIMRHLSVDYYVGWLSAAAIHGAAHQAPQVFQVAVNRHLRDRAVGRTRFSFAQRDVTQIPITAVPTRDGSARVSTVEATMLDVANDPIRAAGIDNAATVIVELAELESFDVTTLAALADRFPAATGRRLGWILSQFTDGHDLGPLRSAVRDAVPSASRLDAHTTDGGPLDDAWMLVINRELEPEA